MNKYGYVHIYLFEKSENRRCFDTRPSYKRPQFLRSFVA